MSNFTEVDTQPVNNSFEQARNALRVNALNESLGLNLSPIALTAETPSSDDFDNLLADAGKAPGGTSVITVPSSPQSYDLELVRNVQILDSYIALLTAFVIYNKHPEPYNLSDQAQAAQFVIDTANAKNFVVTGGTVKDIVMYLPNMGATSQNKTLTTTSAKIHVDLLAALFGSMNFPAEVLSQLDGVLTEVTATLKSLSLSFQTQTETLNHTVAFYYLSPVKGSNPPINEVKVRLLYMEIDQSSWKASLGKSSVERFSFDFKLTTTTATMSNGLVSANAAKIQSEMQKLCAKDASEISKLTGAKGVKTDSA